MEYIVTILTWSIHSLYPSHGDSNVLARLQPRINPGWTNPFHDPQVIKVDKMRDKVYMNYMTYDLRFLFKFGVYHWIYPWNSPFDNIRNILHTCILYMGPKKNKVPIVPMALLSAFPSKCPMWNTRATKTGQKTWWQWREVLPWPMKAILSFQSNHP